MPREIVIDGVRVADDTDAYVVAEIGHNHQGSLEQARELYRRAAECGVNAVKLQKRHNPTLFTKRLYDAPYDNENSFGATYGEHREALEFGRSEYLELKAFCAELEIDFFATAFDLPSVDFLEEVDLPAYKVASADIRNTPLLNALAQTGKPVIISTGGASMESVVAAYDVLAANDAPTAILQCTAGYPAAWDELDLRVIQTYREEFPSAVVGLSSHDNGIAMAIAAYALGARIIEKHFTLDRTWRGTDHKFSLEPQGMGKLVRDLRRLEQALGDGTKCVYESEKAPIVKMSKSLVAARDLPAGHVLRAQDIAMKSPGDGLAPSELTAILGARLLAPIAMDTQLAFELVEVPVHDVSRGKAAAAAAAALGATTVAVVSQLSA